MSNHKLIGFVVVVFCVSQSLGCGPKQPAPPKGTLLVVSNGAIAKNGLNELFELRKRQGWGIEITEILGATSPSIVDVIARAKKKNESISHVLLVGDETSLPMARQANHRVQEVQEPEEIPTDEPYGLPDAKGVPQLAVGRIPSNSVDELRKVAAKTIEYESKLSALKPEVFVLSGRELLPTMPNLGGQSLQSVVDDTSLSFVDDLGHKVGGGISLRPKMAVPGPHFYPFEKSLETFQEGLSGQPMMSIYVGHANRDAFATMHAPDKQIGIQSSDLSRLNVVAVSGPFFSGGCETLQPEGGGDCLGKKLLLMRGGPVCVAGYAGINEDFCVMRVFEVMAEEIGQSKGSTVGEFLVRLKRRVVEEPSSSRVQSVMTMMALAGQLTSDQSKMDLSAIVRKNNALLTLIGDPTATLGVPAASAESGNT